MNVIKNKKVNINFKIDKDLKIELENLCDELGITLTTAFTMFAKKFAREKAIPFQLNVDPFYSEANQKRLKQSIEQLENNGGTHYNK